MGDFLLSAFHSTFDDQRNEGCLSLYYSNYIPMLSFSRYSSNDNDDIQEYPFPSISYIYIDTEKDGDNSLNVFVKDQLYSASIFRLPSKYDLLSFIQITVSNGILNSDASKQHSNKWFPVLHVKPKKTIQWIYDNSPNSSNSKFLLSSIYRNSHPPFCQNPLNASFSLTNHREILRDLIDRGKQTDLFQKLHQISLKSEFQKRYFLSEKKFKKNKEEEESIQDDTKSDNDNDNDKNSEAPTEKSTENQKETETVQSSINDKSDDSKSDSSEKVRDIKLIEYLNVRKQWENRISHQNLNNSKHNNDVEKILKDLPRTVSNEKTIILLYNVLRTMITYAPDVGFAQGMVDVSYFIADVVLDDIQNYDDLSQSKVFWGLNEILFKFGQSDWFLASEIANSRLVSVIDPILTKIYPTAAEFIRFNDFEVFKHCFGSFLTMFTRMFAKEVIQKLWILVFLKRKVVTFHAAVLASLFCFNFPKLSESKTVDMSQISDLMNSRYLVENEDSFLAVVASFCEMIQLDDEDDLEDSESFDDFECSLFKPLSI